MKALPFVLYYLEYLSDARLEARLSIQAVITVRLIIGFNLIL